MKEPLYDNILEFQVYGESALFCNPITMVSEEQTSYQVPTYSALQGIMESCYWKPTIYWQPLEVRVMNRIRLEPRSKLMPKYVNSERDLAYHTYLRDVCYQVRVAMQWSNNLAYEKDRNPKKHMESARRWLERGGKKNIFLGKAECFGFIEPCTFGEGKGYYDNTDMSFGLMLHGQTYPNLAKTEEEKNKHITRLFFCEMEKGIIKFPAPEECPVKRVIREEEPFWNVPKY